jgi:hypothetical protein
VVCELFPGGPVSTRLDDDKGRIALDAELVDHVVVRGPVYFCKQNLLSVLGTEVVDKFVPLFLKLVAPVAVLHVEVEDDEAVFSSISQ